MSQRISALRSKLPADVLSIIRSYDSHPVTDIIREIEFERLPGHVYAASGLRLKNVSVRISAQLCPERLRHNRSLKPYFDSWLPILFETKTWVMSFPRWQFETLEDLE